MLNILEIKNFTCFPEAKLEFSPGLNIIVGENGTGKSHLLKLGYTVLRSLAGQEKAPVKEVYSRDLATGLKDIFKAETLGNLCTVNPTSSICSVKSTWGSAGHLAFDFSDKSQELVKLQNIEFNTISEHPIFIPPKEILSIFYGFQAALEKRELDFDATYLDLARALSSTPLKGEQLNNVSSYFREIEQKHMKATVSQNGGRFYFEKSSYSTNEDKTSLEKKEMEAHLMAEGFRKLGVLVYLIKNGSLGEGSSLFWDEPEANLNPKLLTALAFILLKLASVMQITIATHSLFLLRELEVLQENKNINKICYFGLHFNSDDNGVNVIQGDSINDIGDIAALDEALAQSNRYYESQDKK